MTVHDPLEVACAAAVVNLHNEVRPLFPEGCTTGPFIIVGLATSESFEAIITHGTRHARDLDAPTRARLSEALEALAQELVAS